MYITKTNFEFVPFFFRIAIEIFWPPMTHIVDGTEYDASWLVNYEREAKIFVDHD